MNRAVTALASDSAATTGKIRPVLPTYTGVRFANG
jgi:hypothetical protein